MGEHESKIINIELNRIDLDALFESEAFAILVAFEKQCSLQDKVCHIGI